MFWVFYWLLGTIFGAIVLRHFACALDETFGGRPIPMRSWLALIITVTFAFTLWPIAIVVLYHLGARNQRA